MYKVFLSFCILFSVSFLFAVSPQDSPIQTRFDKLAAHQTFGEAEVAELHAIMEEEKESDGKLDCTLCPDAALYDE